MNPMKEYLNIMRNNDIAVVIMKREDKLNALNIPMIYEIITTLTELEKDDSIKAVILTGSGNSFVVGADINVMKKLDTITGIDFISTLQKLMGTIRGLSKPVIAGINGYCFGAGLELAISCDMSIASEEAVFGMQEVKLGIPSVIEAALFPFVIGLNKTRELLLTGETISSTEAETIGLVSYTVKNKELLNVCTIYAKKIIQNPMHAVSMQKSLINRWLENAGLDLSIKTGIDSFGISFSHEDTKLALANGLKKRS